MFSVENVVYLCRKKIKSMKKDNFVIEVLDLEHGQKVKKYFESLSIDTCRYAFDNTKKYDDTYRYYGVIDGMFDNYNEEQIPPHVEIINLPVEAEKTLEEKIKELALSKNKVIKKLELEDIKDIQWCLVWDKGSLKPNIVERSCVGVFDKFVPFPAEMNEFITKNFIG